MKAYIIVKGTNLEEVQEKAEELAVEGYLPTGGPSQIMSSIVQAMYHPAVCNAMIGVTAHPGIKIDLVGHGKTA